MTKKRFQCDYEKYVAITNKTDGRINVNILKQNSNRVIYCRYEVDSFGDPKESTKSTIKAFKQAMKTKEQ